VLVSITEHQVNVNRVEFQGHRQPGPLRISQQASRIHTRGSRPRAQFNRQRGPLRISQQVSRIHTRGSRPRAQLTGRRGHYQPHHQPAAKSPPWLVIEPGPLVLVSITEHQVNVNRVDFQGHRQPGPLPDKSSGFRDSHQGSRPRAQFNRQPWPPTGS
jgi:hypothetical protein